MIGSATMHPTAARMARRLEQRGLQIEVRTLSDSARTAALAAAAGTPHDVCAGDRRRDPRRDGDRRQLSEGPKPCSRNQATVRSRPSCSPTAGRQPSISRALAFE